MMSNMGDWVCRYNDTEKLVRIKRRSQAQYTKGGCMTVKGSGPHLPKFLLSNCQRESSGSSFATMDEYEELFFYRQICFCLAMGCFLYTRGSKMPFLGVIDILVDKRERQQELCPTLSLSRTSLLGLWPCRGLINTIQDLHRRCQRPKKTRNNKLGVSHFASLFTWSTACCNKIFKLCLNFK